MNINRKQPATRKTPMQKTARTLLAALAFSAASGGALAQNFITDKAQVETLLTGAKARWWVDDQARYCREWLDGKLKGNTGCMTVELEDGQVALYSDGKKVVEGIVTGN